MVRLRAGSLLPWLLPSCRPGWRPGCRQSSREPSGSHGNVAMRIGVDTGGTFTDFAALADDGAVGVLKVPSMPADPSQAILDGLAQIHVSDGFALIHGTTVATNALLERRGAKTALLTTQGCRDVLEIA